VFAALRGLFRNGYYMEAKLNSLTPSQVSPSAGHALPAIKKVDSKTQGSDFSQVLSGQMFKTQRQFLADSPSESAGLQVVPLGKNMNVITSDAALPDMESLTSFARAQGFDDTAIQALFGTKPTA